MNILAQEAVGLQSMVALHSRVSTQQSHGLIGAGVYARRGYERSHADGVHNTLLVLKGYLGV